MEQTNCNVLRIIHILLLMVVAEILAIKKCSSPEASATRPCKREWEELTEPRTCVKLFNSELTWANAQKACWERGGNLAIAHNVYSYLQIQNLPLPKKAMWFGLNTLMTEMWVGSKLMRTQRRYQWLSETFLPGYNRWGLHNTVHEGNGSCAYIDKNRMWVKSVCERKLPYLCQESSQIGPRETVMDPSYHGPKYTYYLDGTIQLTCTSYGVQRDRIKWAVVNKDGIEMTLAAKTTDEFVLAEASNGACLNYSRSTYSVRVTKALQDSYINCYAYEPSEWQRTCANELAASGLCDSTGKIIVQDGPRKPLYLKVAYHGMPWPVMRGDLIRAMCSVHPGQVGGITWVLELPDSQLLPVAHDDPRVTTMNGTGDAVRSKRVISVLQLEMTAAYDGGFLSCHAHDTPSFRAKPICEEKDDYCISSIKLYTHPAKIVESAAWDFTLWSLMLLALLLSITTLACIFPPTMKTCVDSDFHGKRKRRMH